MEQFYWRIERDNILTPAGISMFQILASHDGEDFDEAKKKIDSEYLLIRGRDESKRHGGVIQTQISAFQMAGWVELESYNENKQRIKITEAGKQARLLLSKLPDFFKVIPYFVIELLARYQINNPARPKTSKNPEYDALLAECNVFPYWTLYKVMHDCDFYITTDELRRFVFKIQKSEEIDNVISLIKSYRADKEAGLSEEQLNSKYPEKLAGAVAEPKYIMNRLGTQVGEYPPLIEKEGQSKYVLNRSYVPFIKEILSNAPIFKEHITEKSWMAEHGKCVENVLEYIAPPGDEDDESEIITDELPDDDPVWLQTKDLLDHGAAGIIYSGPPGTSKTWYASRIAVKLAKGKAKCIKNVQFHPSYNYDDFVEGYIPGPEASTEESGLFKVVDKIFMKTSGQAQRNPTEKYIIVIDEFSRGDPSRIFGELLTYIEKAYRNKKFILPYSGKKRMVPDNIIMLGTMNPYDKSVTDLDAAMDRRFEMIALEPSLEMVKQFVTAAGMQGELMGKVLTFFTEANNKCPHGLGHTYFIHVKDETDLMRLWNHKLRFIFEKMFRFEQHIYNDLKEEFKKVLQDSSKLL